MLSLEEDIEISDASVDAVPSSLKKICDSIIAVIGTSIEDANFEQQLSENWSTDLDCRIGIILIRLSSDEDFLSAESIARNQFFIFFNTYFQLENERMMPITRSIFECTVKVCIFMQRFQPYINIEIPVDTDLEIDKKQIRIHNQMLLWKKIYEKIRYFVTAFHVKRPSREIQ